MCLSSKDGAYSVVACSKHGLVLGYEIRRTLCDYHLLYSCKNERFFAQSRLLVSWRLRFNLATQMLTDEESLTQFGLEACLVRAQTAGTMLYELHNANEYQYGCQNPGRRRKWWDLSSFNAARTRKQKRVLLRVSRTSMKCDGHLCHLDECDTRTNLQVVRWIKLNPKERVGIWRHKFIDLHYFSLSIDKMRIVSFTLVKSNRIL